MVEAQRGVVRLGGRRHPGRPRAANGQVVRGHTLVWHNQLPTWLTPGTFTNDELARDPPQAHHDEAAHSAGKIQQWDVVNEALDEDGTLRHTIWLRQLGPGYIADAFRWAHQADPQALLLQRLQPRVHRAQEQRRATRSSSSCAEGVPIDGVGFQGYTLYLFARLRHALSYDPAVCSDSCETCFS